MGDQIGDTLRKNSNALGVFTGDYQLSVSDIFMIFVRTVNVIKLICVN